MPRLMKINPRFRGGMVKTLRGLRPLIKRVRNSIDGSGVVRPLIGNFTKLAIEDKKTVVGGKVKQSYGVKPLKFLM